MAGKTSGVGPDDVVHAVGPLNTEKLRVNGRTVRDVVAAASTKRAGLMLIAAMVKQGKAEIHPPR